MSVYCSIFAYCISKFCDDPDAFVANELEAGEKAEWPCFRTLSRLRQLEPDLYLTVDCTTLIDKARSRAAAVFLRGEHNVWVSIDDDIEASEKDLRLLLSAARDTHTDVVVTPCMLRNRTELNIVASTRKVRLAGSPVPVDDTTAKPPRLVECDRAGLALAAFQRGAIECLSSRYPELHWVDPASGNSGLGVFLQMVYGGRWIGEDHAFCTRATAVGLRIEALCDSEVAHAGVKARIADEWLTAPEALTDPRARVLST